MIESIFSYELNYNMNIIDIRSIEKYNNGHILNSINIPSEKLLLNPSKYLNKNTKYYIYCQKGLSSPNICRILKNMGFNVVNVKDGYEGWVLRK